MLKKILLTLLLVLIGISALSGNFEKRIIGGTALHRIDENAQAYYDRTFRNALYTYGIVRGINAVISVIQGSDIALSPAGMGINLAVGEILDPLNDLIERFSWICLAATTSLGIQKILMTVSAWLGFTVLLAVAMAVLAVSIWAREVKGVTLLHMGLRLTVIALVLRYALPVTAFATDRIDTLFFQQTYEEASATLEEANSDLQDERVTPAAREDMSLLDKFKNLFQNVDRAVQLESRVQKLKATVAGYTNQVIDLIAIFILQTLIVPLAMLYLLLRLAGWLLRMDLVSLLQFRKRSVIHGKIRAR